MLIGNLRQEDLRFARSPFDDQWRLPIVRRSLDDALGTADELLGWHERGRLSPAAALLTALGDQILAATTSSGASAVRTGQDDDLPGAVAGAAQPVRSPATQTPSESTATALASLPPELRGPLARLHAAVARANADVRAAIRGLTPAELREVIEGLPTLVAEEPKVKLSFVRGPVGSRDRVLELVGRIDRARLQSAAAALTAEAEEVGRALKAARVTFSGKVRLSLGGLPAVVAGTGDDVHTETDARITVDLGGDDVYRGRHGAGVGYAAVQIDCAGDDRYDVPDLSVGAGVAGIGVSLDLGGHDSFRSGSLAFGAGVAGVGVFVKIGGDDHYRSGAMAQGFGAFGTGLLIDTGGNDTYDVALFGQGAARTQGVGWLIDRAGDDVYRAGGLSMNEPLFTGVSYSFAQGFASGFREDAGGVSGGVGLLTDARGSDAYVADTYAQAASYWFALGSLADLAGNDTYTAHHYAQSSAMHCCSAYLFDLAGDDAYVTKVGASLAIGHDYGVAFLLDRAGNDLYTARDSTPGIGIANGLGVFVDSAGDDRYDGPPAQGNAARGTGSLGLFVDLTGEDKYRRGLEDGQARVSPTWSAAYDAATQAAVVAAPSPAPQAATATPGSRPIQDEAGMAELYRKATQWGVGSAQTEVEASVRELTEIGVPALEWMLERRLAGANRLQIRAFVTVVRGIGPAAAAPLGAKALSGTKGEVRNLIAIASEAGVTDFGALIPNWLDDPDLQLPAARAAGPLKAMAAVPGLMRVLLDDDRFLVRAAMASLAQIGDPASSTTPQAMADHPDYLTRMAAQQLLGRFPEVAAPLGTRWAADADEFRARLGLQILGRLGTAEALATVAGVLLDPRPGVRVEALLQLEGRVPAGSLPVVESLKQDPVAVVRAVAVRVGSRR